MNPYSAPESFDPPLELMGVLTLRDEPYQFALVILVRVKGSARYFMAADSGCSCPQPFEDFEKLSDLTRVTLRATKAGTSFSALARLAQASISDRDAQGLIGAPGSPEAARDFIRIVRRAERHYLRSLHS